MVLTESKVNIVCDIKGCKNVAKYFIRKDNTAQLADSLKLCPTCSATLLKLLQKKFAKKETLSGKDI